MITIPGKIPIRIYPVFWLFMLLISALNAHSLFTFLVWVGVILASVIIHEMGHALTAVAFGQKAHIDLLGFGGLTHRHGKPLNAWKNFLIVLNGPLAGCLLCIGSFFLLQLPLDNSPKLYYTLTLLLYANVIWTLINLIPVQPLDGGHLLRIVLEGFFGLRGVKTALFIGLIIAIAAGVFFFAFNQLLLGVLFMMLTYENYTAWKGSLEISAQDQDSDLKRLFGEAQQDHRQGDQAAAIAKLKAVREHTSGGVLYSNASLLLAEIYSSQGNANEAFSLLYPMRKKLPPSALRLLLELAYKNKAWDEAVAIGALAYQAEPQQETAVINAMVHAQRQEAQQAVSWLKCAIRDGLPERSPILNGHAFDPIRQDPLFRQVSG